MASGKSSRRPWRWLGLAACLAAVAMGCNENAAPTSEKRPADVVVTTPITDEVEDYQDFTGRLDALKTVDIRARVSGFVLTAPFKEGDYVHEGDILFQIDPQSYRADANLAASNLKLAQADENLQQKNSARARVMIGNRSMAPEDYDTSIATYEKARATVQAMAAVRDRAQLYLDWTRVTAPLSGRISRRLVDPGNLVNADQTILTTLVSDSQLYAYFDVDERTYLNLVGTATSAKDPVLDTLQFPVLMQLANEEQLGFTRRGVVNFVDNRVNAATGTIRMRAIFDNAKGALRAGLFVRIRLPIGTPYRATLIPAQAIQVDQGRHFVFLVNYKNEVEYRSVELGQEIQGLQVIRPPTKGKEGKEGLALGEKVLISGMQRVRKGSLVQVKEQPPPKPPESPLGKLLQETAKVSR
jgi:RND family efflux transporter MFP subunit